MPQMSAIVIVKKVTVHVGDSQGLPGQTITWNQQTIMMRSLCSKQTSTIEVYTLTACVLPKRALQHALIHCCNTKYLEVLCSMMFKLTASSPMKFSKRRGAALSTAIL